jgi:hypothetical protein
MLVFGQFLLGKTGKLSFWMFGSWKEPERDSRGVFTVLFWDGSRAYTSGNAPTSTEAMIVTLIANTH